MPTTSTKVTQLEPAPFLIEEGVPIPDRRQSVTGALRALLAAKIGASVFFAGHRDPNNIRTIANHLAGKGMVVVRKVDNGVRVWKVSEPEAR